MRGRSFNTLAIAAFSVLLLTACEADDADRPATDVDRPAPEAPADPMPPADLPAGVTAEDWQEGRRLFTGQGGCAACHGPQAAGTQLGPDLTDDQWLNVAQPTMDEIMRVIREGVSPPVQYPAPMPPMGGARLSDDQVHALAAYIMALN